MNKEPQTIDSLYDRQEILSNIAGYFAPTHRELSEALTVIGTRDSNGVAQHLDEIYRRQQYNRVQKPENAVKAVTKEYIANYRSSESTAKQLGSLALDITEIFNPNIMLGEEVRDIKSGHRALVRYIDLKQAYSDPENIDLQNKVLEYAYFNRDTSIIDYINEKLSTIKVKDARKLVVESIEDQNNRSIFWLGTIKSLKAHRVAGPIIRASLIKN